MGDPRPIVHVQHTVLEQIRNGMNVFDRNGDRLGHVARVYFGAAGGTLQAHSTGAAGAPDQTPRRDQLVEGVLAAISAEESLPETVRNRLLKEGFLEIAGDGLFARNRYVLREQIANVSGDNVHLTTTQNELIER